MFNVKFKLPNETIPNIVNMYKSAVYKYKSTLPLMVIWGTFIFHVELIFLADVCVKTDEFKSDNATLGPYDESVDD